MSLTIDTKHALENIQKGLLLMWDQDLQQFQWKSYDASKFKLVGHIRRDWLTDCETSIKICLLDSHQKVVYYYCESTRFDTLVEISWRPDLSSDLFYSCEFYDHHLRIDEDLGLQTYPWFIEIKDGHYQFRPFEKDFSNAPKSLEIDIRIN